MDPENETSPAAPAEVWLINDLLFIFYDFKVFLKVIQKLVTGITVPENML
jgi:hypothetical protein